MMNFQSKNDDFGATKVYVLLMAHALACVFFLWPELFVKECTDSGLEQHESQKECTPLGSW